MKFPSKLNDKLELRKQTNSYRELGIASNLIDFSSNDYLGFAKSEAIFSQTHQFLLDKDILLNGATGSRLLTGNSELFTETETYIAQFHQAESALLFNSGYNANVGFFSAIPQRDDILLYDELCHASIRDGIVLSNAKAYKFEHNNLDFLEKKLILLSKNNTKAIIYIVTESVFSMDGDSPNLEELVMLSEKFNCNLVIDEAHALGVFGSNGQGLIQELNVQDKIFARIITFGKALGCHGAVILGSVTLKNYLINFCRSFIYTTGLPPHAIATILVAYTKLNSPKNNLDSLKQNILLFNRELVICGLKNLFVYSKSAIQCAIIPSNTTVKKIAQQMQNNGFDCRAILSPTVPEGQERLRICLHSYNSEQEINKIIYLLSTFVF
jgi:8-amino-7-oxononanoate synthase